MSIADQITRLNNAKANIKQAIENKGVEVSDSALLDEYPALISSIPMEGGDPYYEEFYNIRTSNGTSMDALFARTSGELDLRKVDTSNVTSMQYMFDSSTASINIDGWDTSNVTNMSYMFNYFTGSIDISKLDTSNVTNTAYMFYGANTDKIILTGLSFPSTTSLSIMFYNATGTTLDLSSWDISNITNMYNIFSNAKYTRIDLTGWNTSKVTNMSNMFGTYDSPLIELIIPDWDMAKASNNIFYNSSYIPNLKLIDLSRSNDATIIKIASYLPTRTATTFGTVLVPENTSQEAYDALIAKYWAPIGAAMIPVPTSCNIVAELDEIMPGKSTKVYIGACEPWNADPSKVEIVLVSGNSIATIDDDNEVISTGVIGDIVLEARIIDTQEVIGTKTIVVSETDSYPNLVKFRMASTPTLYSIIVTVNGSSKKLSDLTYDSITDIYSYDAGAPITSIKFDDDSNINELIKLNTSNVTNMYTMFYNCNNLTSLDVSNWDTSKVTNMGYMFQNCGSLQSLDVSNWDTSNVTNIYGMFQGCTSLHTLRLDNCSNDTINKIITSRDFPTNAIEGVTRTIYCKEENAAGLTAPTNWVFSYITEEEPEVPVDPPAGDIPLYVPGEFQGNTEITEVVTMVNESHTDLSYMFYGCENLTYANTQDWDVSNVTTVDSMFCSTYGMPVTSLDFSTWDTSNITNMNSMFAYMQSSYLRKIDLSSFNTKKLEMSYGMFNWCVNLHELDIRNFELVHEDGTEAAIAGMLEGCNELYALHLDNCSNATISKIINESGIPTDTDTVTYYDYDRYDYITVTRRIYCKESEAAGLTPPTNWEFVFVE